MKAKGYREVAIIILNYNGLVSLGPRLLYKCLKSVLETRYPSYVVLFVDNGSRDKSVAFVLRYFEDYFRKGVLEIVKLDKNYGWSGGNNRGAIYAIKKYRPKFLLFLNNDVYIDDPLWLDRIVRSMNKYGLDLASPLVYERSLGFLVAGNVIGEYGESKPFIITKTLLDRMRAQGIEIIPSKYLHGATLVVHSHAFKVLGGFDERFLAYYDETDFCERAHKHGFRIAAVTVTIVHHYGSATFRKMQHSLVNLKTERTVESLLRFVRKHYGFTRMTYAVLNITKWLLAEACKANLRKVLAILEGLTLGLRNSLR